MISRRDASKLTRDRGISFIFGILKRKNTSSAPHTQASQGQPAFQLCPQLATFPLSSLCDLWTLEDFDDDLFGAWTHLNDWPLLKRAWASAAASAHLPRASGGEETSIQVQLAGKAICELNRQWPGKVLDEDTKGRAHTLCRLVKLELELFRAESRGRPGLSFRSHQSPQHMH